MTTITTTPASADELGTLLAQIATLTKQAEAIKDAMKDVASKGDTKVFEGALFKATYCCVQHQENCTLIGGQHEQDNRLSAGYTPLDRSH
jgi:cell division protein YceG involved in septum cleavage